jgi:hypothetical protein
MPAAQLLANGKVLIAGGSDDSLPTRVLGCAELYDPATRTFSSSSGTMISARYRATCSPLPGPDRQLGTPDDSVLVVGGLVGYTDNPEPSQVGDSAEIYIP